MMIMEHIGCSRGCYDEDLSGSGETKSVTLKFHREQLMYDISNYAYIEGEVLQTDNTHLKHTLTDIADEGNVDRINRILAAVHASVVEMLYPYTKEDAVDDEEICDRMWTPAEYRIKLHIPATMSRTTLHLLSRLIHEYIVCRALSDWLSITNVPTARTWLEKAMEAEEEINTIKNHRTATLTRKTQLF